MKQFLQHRNHELSNYYFYLENLCYKLQVEDTPISHDGFFVRLRGKKTVT